MKTPDLTPFDYLKKILFSFGFGQPGIVDYKLKPDV